MKVGMVLRPGQEGTQKLQEEFGEALVCVRYRYDGESSRRIKTVEIIVDESEWERPAPKAPVDEKGPHQVDVRIPIMREDLVSTLRRKHAEYDEETKEWRIPYTVAVRMGLRRYIVSRVKAPTHSFALNLEAAKGIRPWGTRALPAGNL